MKLRAFIVALAFITPTSKAPSQHTVTGWLVVSPNGFGRIDYMLLRCLYREDCHPSKTDVFFWPKDAIVVAGEGGQEKQPFAKWLMAHRNHQVRLTVEDVTGP